MSYYPEFSHLLNQALQRQERPASWLAQRLGVSPSTVMRWLNHGTRPGAPEVIVQIADILSITAQQQQLLHAAGYGYQPTSAATDNAPRSRTARATPAPTHPETQPWSVRLPIPPTPLVGRTAERTQLTTWLADPIYRLLTIVGPGGIGKTRLALAIAEEQLASANFEQGVAFVDLAPLTSVEQIPAAIAHVVGLPFEQGGEQVRSAAQQVVDFFQSRQLLLVLDNAEHLLDGTPLITAILAGAPAVQLLVTSRAPLRLPGEQLYPLQGLAYPREREPAVFTAGDAQEMAAVTLFLQAARRVRPDYTTGTAGATATALEAAEYSNIRAICQLVEGMPLAIELAASWVTVMAAADILSAIQASLQFLEADLRGVAERHRSMEAVFDATWQRLPTTEQQMFAQLSVFRGGFTQEAVKQITGVDLRLLRSLNTSSLISYDHQRGRYTIHELLRQYGALRLADMGDLEVATNAAHSTFYMGFLQRRQDALKQRGLQTDLWVLDAEVDNLSRAWQWAAGHGQVVALMAVLDGFGLYLQWRGRAAEGEAAFGAAATALKQARTVAPLVRALTWQALFVRVLGQGQQAVQLLEQARQLLTAPLAEEDRHATRAFVLLQLALGAAGHDTAAARRYYEESLVLYTTLGDHWYAAEVRLGLGHLCLTQGDFAGQRTHVQEALDAYRTLGNVRGTAAALSMLADIDSYRGQLMRGLDLGLESLAAFRSLGDLHGIATCLSRIGYTYINLGDVVNARQVVNESAALLADIGSRRDEVIAYAFLCAIELMAGDYSQALANAQRSLAIATKLDDQFVLGVAFSFVGWAQLYTGNLHGALQTLRNGVAVAKQTGATMELTRCYALLGFAQWRNGQVAQARAHCYESLRLCVQVGDPWSLLTAISSTLVLLLHDGHLVRALELHTMLMQDRLCAACCWFAEGIGQHVTATLKKLPTSTIETAISTGRMLKQQETAAHLLAEVQALGWAEANGVSFNNMTSSSISTGH